MLKRLSLLLTATAVLIGSPLAADLAHAQGRGDGRGDGRRYERRGEPDGPGRPDRGGRQRQRFDDSPRRAVERRREDFPRSDERREDDRGDGRGRRGPGGYLPPDSRAGVVGDPGRYRLRPAPRGYAWVRMGAGFALVSLSDGRIYDRID